MKKTGIILGSFFGAGFFPIAPGTFASLITVIILYIIPGIGTVHLIITALFSVFAGIWASNEMENHYGKDPSCAVIDETAGMIISVILVEKTILLWGIAFLMFRFFDILKPFPINKSQKLKSGLGIMADDVLAGIYTCFIVNLLETII